MSKHPTLGERLAGIEVTINDIKKDLENHLAHHATFIMVLCGVILTQSVALIIAVIKLLS